MRYYVGRGSDFPPSETHPNPIPAPNSCELSPEPRTLNPEVSQVERLVGQTLNGPAEYLDAYGLCVTGLKQGPQQLLAAAQQEGLLAGSRAVLSAIGTATAGSS